MEGSRESGIVSSAGLEPAISALTELARLAAIKTLKIRLGSEAKLYLVGGSVREALSGKPRTSLLQASHGPAEVDLACCLSVDQTKRLLSSAAVKVVDTGLKHGTITAVIEGLHLELTSFRDAAAPQSIEADLALRDFTINAIAFDLDKHQLLDPFKGIEDLKRELVRAVGDAALRFKEDPLRILRMLRFGPASLRKIEEQTLQAAKEHVHLLKQISPERVREELRRIIIRPGVKAAFTLMHEIGALKLLLPEFIPSIGFEQNEFHCEDVFNHTLSVVAACPAQETVRWAALFHDTGKPASFSVDHDGRRHFYNHEKISAELSKAAMSRLRFSNADIEHVAALVRHHMRPLECGPAGIRRLMRDLSTWLDDWITLKIADAPPVMPKEEFKQRLLAFQQLLKAEQDKLHSRRLPKLRLDGYDLQELGFKPGPLFGKILSALEEEILDQPDLNKPDYLKTRARELANKFAGG